jgi:hypothetical protein
MDPNIFFGATNHMAAHQHIAYISSHCPNCARFVDAVRTSPKATKEVRLVDVDAVSAAVRSSLSVVPTVHTAGGKMLAGSQAFEFLKLYESDSELGVYEIGAGSLVFSDFASGDGKPQSVGFFEAFEPLP